VTKETFTVLMSNFVLPLLDMSLLVRNFTWLSFGV
jgi:hypothetical protein